MQQLQGTVKIRQFLFTFLFQTPFFFSKFLSISFHIVARGIKNLNISIFICLWV